MLPLTHVLIHMYGRSVTINCIVSVLMTHDTSEAAIEASFQATTCDKTIIWYFFNSFHLWKAVSNLWDITCVYRYVCYYWLRSKIVPSYVTIFLIFSLQTKTISLLKPYKYVVLRENSILTICFSMAQTIACRQHEVYFGHITHFIHLTHVARR